MTFAKRKIYKYPHIHVGMATKNISITEEAYNRLANLKKGNESFSEIIVEITGRKKLSDFFGIISKETGDKLERAIEKGRKEHRKLTEERHKGLMKEFT